MHVPWQVAIQEALHCGFSHAVLLPARRLEGYVPNAEAAKQRIGDDPFVIMPQAKSVLVAAMPFSWYSEWPAGYGEVSAFYFVSQRAHLAVAQLAERLREMGAQAETDQWLPAKMLGRDAGFGVFGCNCLLRNDTWGSSFSLRLLVTDIEPQPEIIPLPAPSCGPCRRCMDACPTGALHGDGQLDTAKCLRSYMLAGEVVPEMLRAQMGTRLLGCEICQRVCPHNRQQSEVQPPEIEAFRIDRLLTGARPDLDMIGDAIGWNEARLQRVQAQAALTAGNTLNPQYLPLLQPLAAHTRPAIAEHARWAINRIEKGRDTSC